MKFSVVGCQQLAEICVKLRKDDSCANQSVKYLRPTVRALLLKVTAGERIPPEFSRVTLTGCLKVAALKTISSKDKGLRIQTSDIIFGEAGAG